MVLFNGEITRVGGYDLCEDTLILILNRLKTKCLFRLKCVSKRWNNLISYIYVHRKLPGPMSLLLYQSLPFDHFQKGEFQQVDIKFFNLGPQSDDGIRLRLRDLSFLPSYPALVILDCLNGLVLLSTRQNVYKERYICNPVLKKFVTLPPCKFRTCTPYNAVTALVFDPRVSPHYKVITFSQPGKRLFVEIFSSETGRSALFLFTLKDGFCINIHRRPVFLNGALHLLLSNSSIMIFDDKKLDNKKERLCCITLPKGVSARIEHPFYACLGESGGRLCVSYQHEESDIRIWVLEDYDKVKWVLRSRISIEALQRKYPADDIWCWRLLAFHLDKEVIFIGTNLHLFACSLISKKLKKIGTLSDPEVDEEFVFWFFPFSHSLYSLEDNHRSQNL